MSISTTPCVSPETHYVNWTVQNCPDSTYSMQVSVGTTTGTGTPTSWFIQTQFNGAPNNNQYATSYTYTKTCVYDDGVTNYTHVWFKIDILQRSNNAVVASQTVQSTAVYRANCQC